MGKSNYQSALCAAFFLDAGAIICLIFAFYQGAMAVVNPLLIGESIQYVVGGVLSAAMLSGFAALLRMVREGVLCLRGLKND